MVRIEGAAMHDKTIYMQSQPFPANQPHMHSCPECFEDVECTEPCSALEPGSRDRGSVVTCDPCVIYARARTGAMTSGLFVVFEGIDGAGTTTQVRLVAERLRAEGLRVHTTREPSDGPTGVLIREILKRGTHRGGAILSPSEALTMAFLFAADRLKHVEREIDPRLAQGEIVLCDRYDLSSLTYQVATSGKPEAETIKWIRSLNRHCRRPDITFVFHVDPEVAAERRRARGGPAELYDDGALQVRLAAMYRRAKELVPGDRVIDVYASRAPDDIADTVSNLIKVRKSWDAEPQ
jgi:dTMP kinase